MTKYYLLTIEETFGELCSHSKVALAVKQSASVTDQIERVLHSWREDTEPTCFNCQEIPQNHFHILKMYLSTYGG